MTPTDPDAVARIAAGLTKAQRAAVLWCNDGWKERDKQCPRAVSFFVLKEVRKGNPRSEIATVYSLIDISTVRIVNGKWAPDEYALTPLGLAVREHLEANHGKR